MGRSEGVDGQAGSVASVTRVAVLCGRCAGAGMVLLRGQEAARGGRDCGLCGGRGWHTATAEQVRACGERVLEPREARGLELGERLEGWEGGL